MQLLPQVLVTCVTDQVAPFICAYQVDISQVDYLCDRSDITETENTLAPVYALPPEGEHGGAQMQGELGGVGMECGMLAA